MNAAHYVLLAAILLPLQAPAAEQQTNQRQYTYAWQFTEGSDMEPRGGNTSGPEITLADGESAAWRTLVTSEATAKEKDRLAILAMAGAYRASFDFIEVMGFAADYSPTRPYQSWGTEYIYVVADDPDFISLQHILVMTVIRDDGTVQAIRQIRVPGEDEPTAVETSVSSEPDLGKSRRDDVGGYERPFDEIPAWTVMIHVEVADRHEHDAPS